MQTSIFLAYCIIFSMFSPCIIPWGYDHSGEKFYGCADNEPGHLPWCPTGVNDQGFYVSGSGTYIHAFFLKINIS